MTSSSPGTVKKDFGFQQGRLTLPPYSSPGANYIAASSTLPQATSTPVQREMLHYKISWKDKVRNVFRLKKKNKGGFSTDPDVVQFPQPFSRATGAMVHSTPKIFDPTTASVENLALNSSSEDDIPQSLLDDTLPGKVSHSDKQTQKEKARKKDVASPGKDGEKQTSVDDEDGLSNVNSSITEHNESAEHSSTLSPSNLSKSSIKEQSTENSSGEDEEVNDRDSWKSPRTSGEWHEQIGQQKRRKKSVRSMDHYSHRKTSIERPLSAGNSTENLNQEDEVVVRRKLIHNISDSLITDEQRRSKKKKPERIRGPHQSRENLGRPTILDTDIKNQQQSSFEDDDFAAVPLNTRLSTKAAHDKRGAAKNIKRRKATTKRSFFLHTEEEHGTSIVDPSANAESGKSSELQKAEQTVQHLRLRPQQSSSASIVAKAVEKRNSTEKSPVDDVMEQPADLMRTNSKRKFSTSAIINKQILESPLRMPVLPSPSPKPQRNEPNIFEQVKLKPINNSPVQLERRKFDTTSTTITKDKTNIPPIKEKPKRTMAPSPDKTQDLASPVKENIPKLLVNLDTDTKMDTKEAAVSLLLKDTQLPLIVGHNRGKSRRAKTVAQPVKTIGYMKEAPSKPAWIEIAQQKTRRVGEALCSTDKLPQLSPSPAKHKSEDKTFFKNKSSPGEHGTENIKETGLPADGYVRRRLRTFSQDQTPKAL